MSCTCDSRRPHYHQADIERVRDAIEAVLTDNGYTHASGTWVVKVADVRAALDRVIPRALHPAIERAEADGCTVDWRPS